MIIGLTGAAGAGKSTAAAALAAQGFVRVRFADPLKGMLRSFYVQTGLDADEIERRIEGDLKEQQDPILLGSSPRRAMQTLGTEWGRGLIAPNLWTNAWMERARRLKRTGYPVVAEDCRFPNEADTIRALGGVILHIERPGHENPAAGHSSEGHQIEPDAVVLNIGSAEALTGAVNHAVIHLIGVAA